MLFESVEELDVSVWIDFCKVVVINVDGDSLKTFQLWFWVRADSLELDNFRRICFDDVYVQKRDAISGEGV